MSAGLDSSGIATPQPALKKARKLHRWLMAFVGVQLFVWALTGAYMVFPNIHYIHGDHLYKQSMPNLDNQNVKLTFKQVLNRYPNATNIRLGWLGNKAVYRLDYYSEDALRTVQVMLDAQTGLGVRPLQLVDVINLIPELINMPDIEGAAVDTVRLIDADTIDFPTEIGSKGLPVWQVQLNTWDNTRVYISEFTGEVVYVRHHAWRLFDLFWRLHIMDYVDGDEPENLLLAVTTVISALAVIAGLVLLYYKILSPKLAPSGQDTSFLKKGLGAKFKQSHQWLALLVFVQLVLWLISGFLLARIDHPLATGQNTVLKAPKSMPVVDNSAPDLVDIGLLLSQNKHTEAVYLEQLGNRWVYRLQHKKGRHEYWESDYSVVDARTGNAVTISSALASKLALATYQAEDPMSKVRIIGAKKYQQNVPQLPQEQNAVWQLSVNDALNTKIVLNAQTGSLIAHVNDATPLRNLLFKLHFMDYASQGSFNNIFAKLFAALMLLLSFSGLYWLFALLKDGQLALPAISLNDAVIEREPQLRERTRPENWAPSEPVVNVLPRKARTELDAWFASRPNPILRERAPRNLQSELDAWFLARPNPILRAKPDKNTQEALDAWLASRPNPRLVPKPDRNTQEALDQWLLSRPNPRLQPKPDRDTQEALDQWLLSRPNPRLQPKPDRHTQEALDQWLLSRPNPRLTPKPDKNTQEALDTWLASRPNPRLQIKQPSPQPASEDVKPRPVFTQAPPVEHKVIAKSKWEVFADWWSVNMTFAKRKNLYIKILYAVPKPNGRTESNFKITVNPRMTILEGLDNFRFNIPSQCGGGGLCGQCVCQTANKMRIASADKAHLSKQQLDDNFRLACQHRITDVKRITLYK